MEVESHLEKQNDRKSYQDADAVLVQFPFPPISFGAGTAFSAGPGTAFGIGAGTPGGAFGAAGAASGPGGIAFGSGVGFRVGGYRPMYRVRALAAAPPYARRTVIRYF